MSKRRAATENDTRTLAAYLWEITKLPRLTADDERELARRIRHEQDLEALAQLVECNLRFVVSYAKRYRGLGISFLDLVHEGNVGLIEAAKRFDPSRNATFITGAAWWIRQAIFHALSEQVRAFSLPVELSGVSARFSRDVSSLTASIARAPTTRQIAEDLSLSTAAADALVQVSDISLNDSWGLDGPGQLLGETIAQGQIPPIEEDLVHLESIEALAAALLELDSKDRALVRPRHGFEDSELRTLRGIGSRLHLSRGRVRQMESRAKEKLRKSAKLRSHLN